MEEFRRDEYRRRLNAAYEDERRANEYYTGLAGRGNERERYLLGSIANDEYRHAQMLYPYVFAPYAAAEGEALQLTRPELERAIHDELTAIAGYAELATMAPTETERLMFISIIGDEYGHLRILLLMESCYR